MANVTDMINTPTPVVLGDRVYKLRKLQVAEVFGQFEQEIVDEHVVRMQKVAQGLTGKDKVDYLVQMSQAIPSGGELAQMAMRRTGTISGLVKLFKLSLVPEAGVPEPDIVSLISENRDLVRQLSKAMVGVEAKAVQEDGSEVPLSPKATA